MIAELANTVRSPQTKLPTNHSAMVIMKRGKETAPVHATTQTRRTSGRTFGGLANHSSGMCGVGNAQTLSVCLPSMNHAPYSFLYLRWSVTPVEVHVCGWLGYGLLDFWVNQSVTLVGQAYTRTHHWDLKPGVPFKSLRYSRHYLNLNKPIHHPGLALSQYPELPC
jgi:hypothetical protein